MFLPPLSKECPSAGLSPSDFMDGTIFQMGQPPERIDILQRIDGITFDEAAFNARKNSFMSLEQDLLDVKKIRAWRQKAE
jgi:hypothetical protein